MGLTKGEALKIVTAVKETSDYMEDSDHSRSVVASALSDLAVRLAESLGVPKCTCRWGHGSRSWGQRPDETCPRDNFGDDE